MRRRKAVTVAGIAVAVVLAGAGTAAASTGRNGHETVHRISPTATASVDDRGRRAEPGDDRGLHPEPGDDRGVHNEPGDDRGGLRPVPADDDRGHRGGHGDDDPAGHH